MAFTTGDLITASELNSINTMAYKTYSSQSSGWQPDYKWYSHRPSGALLCSLRIDCGAFGGIKLNVALINSSGTVLEYLYSEEIGWNAHVTVTCNSKGQGWYRIWASEGSQVDSGKDWIIYAGQTDCTTGNLLTLYQDPLQGGNRLAGTLLTADVLNSGLAGTING